jgi:hypothetical protein
VKQEIIFSGKESFSSGKNHNFSEKTQPLSVKNEAVSLFDMLTSAEIKATSAQTNSHHLQQSKLPDVELIYQHQRKSKPISGKNNTNISAINSFNKL